MGYASADDGITTSLNFSQFVEGRRW